jgi:hypothetical protein
LWLKIAIQQTSCGIIADSHGDAVRGLIGRISMIEMVPPVLKRALEPFRLPFARWQSKRTTSRRAII